LRIANKKRERRALAAKETVTIAEIDANNAELELLEKRRALLPDPEPDTVRPAPDHSSDRGETAEIRSLRRRARLSEYIFARANEHSLPATSEN